MSVIGGVLLAVAALLTLLALVRLLARYRKPAEASSRLISDSAAIRAAARELAAVRRQREGGGWTPELAGRALAAMRVAGAYAVGRRASLMPAASQSSAGSPESLDGSQAPEEAGRLIVRAGWPRARRVAVSGAITAQSVGRDRIRRAGTAGFAASPLYESLEQALAAFTAAQYGRNGTLDDTALDEALATGGQVLKRARLDQTWVMKRLAARRVERQGDTRAWSR